MHRKIFRSWRTVVALFLVVLALSYVGFAYGFFSESHPVSAEILVVEGWLPEDALDQACDEFIRNKYKLLITTGFPFTKGVKMSSDGMFVFDLKNSIKPSPDHMYEISVKTRGTRAIGEYAHFCMLADSVPLGQAFSKRRVQDYTYTVHQNSPPGLIQVTFDNDAVSKNDDRNLYVYSVSINAQTFLANDSTVTHYGWNGSGYEFRRKLAVGGAGIIANYIISKGVSDSAVVAVETSDKKWSKTYTTALDVRQWLASNLPEPGHSINVFSQGPHARRTWISYRKAFNGSASIGIIACENEEIRTDNWWKTIKGWRLLLYETMGILLAKLVL